MRAWNLTRKEIHYRHDAFSRGLKAAGFDLQSGYPDHVQPGDVVLGWNRYGTIHDTATRIEKDGGIYVCAENGYVGCDANGHQLYAMAIGGHNGSGRWPSGGGERWDALGINLMPWRVSGEHILVAANRSFGRPDLIMPPDWGNDVAKRLRKLTKREVRIRPHPGNHAPKKPLAADLAGAWATVIWSSSAGVHSLIAGVPVFQEAPFWICSPATSQNLKMIEDPAMDDYRRESALHRLAHGQFNLAEIQSGEAFRAVLA